uniref:Uncharacterized protein n=1 Tax=Solanum tuberosum TaxID=4113 RepID=M1DQ46_SOLTU
MEKGKNVEMEPTVEDLRMKLRQFKQEIHETKERRIEVELATAVVQAKSAALDAELATKTASKAARNILFFHEKADVTGPEDTELEAIKEEPEEEIVYRPPFQGHHKEGNKKTTLEAHIHEYRVGAKVIFCALFYEHLRSKRILRPITGITSEVKPEDMHKICVYYPDRNGHTIKQCVELKAAIRDLINIGKIPYMCGDNTLLTCDQPGPVYRSQRILCFTVTSLRLLRERYWIYIASWFEGGVLTPIKRDDGTFDPVGIEIWKPCPYHDAIDHNIGKCLGFRYDVESLINKGRIQVEFPPMVNAITRRSKAPKDSFPSQNSRNGKSTMGDNVEDTGLTYVVMAHPIIPDQNELIMQLMQQITGRRVEIQRRQDLPNSGFALNAPAYERPPLHFLLQTRNMLKTHPQSCSESLNHRPNRPKSPLCLRLLPDTACSSYQLPSATSSSKCQPPS